VQPNLALVMEIDWLCPGTSTAWTDRLLTYMVNVADARDGPDLARHVRELGCFALRIILEEVCAEWKLQGLYRCRGEGVGASVPDMSTPLTCNRSNWIRSAE
jgi:hypothetical protein